MVGRSPSLNIFCADVDPVALKMSVSATSSHQRATSAMTCSATSVVLK